MAASLRRCWAVLLALVAVAVPVMADGPGRGGNLARAASPPSPRRLPGAASRTPRSCGATTWRLIRHQRDLTVHEGIRTTQHSLANCVNCHADPRTGRVTGSKDAFCEGCHSYAAVKLDCFECHADRAKTASTASVEKAK